MTPEHALRALAGRYDDGDGEGARLAAEACRRLEWRRRRGGKVCSRCGDSKPMTAFGPHGETRDGLQPACRECDSRRKRADS